MTGDVEWLEIKNSLPIGMRVAGKVAEIFPFGVVVDLDGHPGVLAVADASSLFLSGEVARQSDWPKEGSVLVATIVGHTEHNRQVKLRAEFEKSVE